MYIIYKNENPIVLRWYTPLVPVLGNLEGRGLLYDLEANLFYTAS